MVTDIKSWSTTAASNTTLSGVSAAEGMAPSLVNDLIRGVASEIREWYEEAAWIDFGHTPTRTANTTFTLATDLTATYHVNRRIRCTDSSVLYATISATSYSAPNTTVTVTLDSGNLSGSLSAVALGAPAVNHSEAMGVFEPIDADILRADTADNLTKGFSTTPYNSGTKTTGTFTPDQDAGNMQYAVNGGAFTLAPPTDNCTVILQVTNNSSAGTITTSGFTLVDGDALTTTNGHDFIFYITKINTFSHLTVKALQ